VNIGYSLDMCKTCHPWCSGKYLILQSNDLCSLPPGHKFFWVGLKKSCQRRPSIKLDVEFLPFNFSLEALFSEPCGRWFDSVRVNDLIAQWIVFQEKSEKQKFYDQFYTTFLSQQKIFALAGSISQLFDYKVNLLPLHHG
jgi:hypothetical protein